MTIVTGALEIQNVKTEWYRQMKYSQEKLDSIYKRTHGHCHLCRKTLARKNYGRLGSRGAWEVEHSKPRSKGGTDHGNNLYAACISCNRSKRSRSTSSLRAINGFKAAPFSQKQKVRNSMAGAGLFALMSYIVVPPHVRIPCAVVSALVGGAIGYDEDPD